MSDESGFNLADLIRLKDSMEDNRPTVEEAERRGLRDQFAGMVLAGAFAEWTRKIEACGFQADQVDAIAEDAYRLADAMMKAREQRDFGRERGAE